MSEAPNIVVARIEADSDESGPIDLGVYRAHRLEMPAGWTEAPITFQVSATGEAFVDLYTEEGEYVIETAQAGRAIILDQEAFYGIRRFKIRSGTADEPVAQGNLREILVVKAPQ
ncbi:MAG: hypothetical protein U1C74_14770 [Phenylobacterium sp.]|nr:hypothetical protein [Phenylobacterium sp.]